MIHMFYNKIANASLATGSVYTPRDLLLVILVVNLPIKDEKKSTERRKRKQNKDNETNRKRKRKFDS